LQKGFESNASAFAGTGGSGGGRVISFPATRQMAPFPLYYQPIRDILWTNSLHLQFVVLLGAWESNPNQNITNRHLRSEAPFKIADYFASNDTKTLAKMTDKSIYTTVMAQTFSSCGNYLLAANTYGEIAVFKWVFLIIHRILNWMNKINFDLFV
jgi:hypothetical protein